MLKRRVRKSDIEFRIEVIIFVMFVFNSLLEFLDSIDMRVLLFVMMSRNIFWYKKKKLCLVNILLFYIF